MPEVTGTLAILHVSDVHFGPPEVPSHVEAIACLVERERYDAVVISGDLSQRARRREFERAAQFVDRLRRTSPVLVVPGNHDVTWWRSPLHVFGAGAIHAKFRRYVQDDIEPVLQVPGALLVGINTAHGIHLRTLTTKPRDLSIIGDIRPEQLERVRSEFARAAPGDLRVAVMHHNVTRGALSRRFGLKQPAAVLDALAAMGADVVLTGHDHQEQVAIHTPHPTGQSMVVLTAGTISDRSRGKRPSSVFEVRQRADTPRSGTDGGLLLEVTTRTWTPDTESFTATEVQCVER